MVIGGVLDLASVGGQWLDVDEMCRRLRCHPKVIDLASEVMEAMSHWKRTLPIGQCAWSIEMSTSTYGCAKSNAQQKTNDLPSAISTDVVCRASDGRSEPHAGLDPSPEVSTEHDSVIRLHLHACFCFTCKIHSRSSDGSQIHGALPG